MDKVATDALVSMEKAMKRDNIEVNDRQLACARIGSKVKHTYTYMIHVAINPVLHVEGCRTRPGSIVVGHHHAVLISVGSLWLSTCHCSFCFLLYQNCSRPCFLPIFVLLFGLQESSLQGLLALTNGKLLCFGGWPKDHLCLYRQMG
jgi:hypothetical protein